MASPPAGAVSKAGAPVSWSEWAPLRHTAGNIFLALAFFVAALPNVRRLDGGMANAIWMAGALVMGVLSLVRVAPKSARLDARAFGATAGMFALPGLMRAEGASAGPLAQFALALEIFGLLLSHAARITMGRSFGILPANRGIVSNGPFRWVRHPIYLGWLILNFGFVLAYPTARNLAVAICALPFMLWRIDLEEELLGVDPQYRAYRERVRYKLIPGLI